MFYKIIEDCSPYYIKFTYDGLEDLITFVKSQQLELSDGREFDSYAHTFLPFELGQEIIKKLPLSTNLRFKRKRAALMIMQPGKFMYPHKDSPLELCSFNLPIEIADDKCVVSWYNDAEFDDCDVIETPSSINLERIYSRKIPAVQYNRKPRTPSKQLKLCSGEFVLFNTNIFHSVDNTTSTNTRIILGLRLMEDTENIVTFDDAKAVLFTN
jgi:hypothetical protein